MEVVSRLRGVELDCLFQQVNRRMILLPFEPGAALLVIMLGVAAGASLVLIVRGGSLARCHLRRGARRGLRRGRPERARLPPVISGRAGGWKIPARSSARRQGAGRERTGRKGAGRLPDSIVVCGSLAGVAQGFVRLCDLCKQGFQLSFKLGIFRLAVPVGVRFL